MRRAFFFFAFLAALAAPLEAQIGKRVAVQAGSPEDKALDEIDAATDPAKKLALLDKFLAEFGRGDIVLLAYERYITTYLAAQSYDKVFESGEKLLAIDPDSFSAAVNLVRAAQEKGDQAKLFDYGGRVGGIVQRFKARPVPEGTDPTVWAQKNAETLAEIKDNLNYVAYALFSVAVQVQNPTERAALLERYVAAFPDSPYAENAQALVAAAYQQAQNYPKMLGFAQNVLVGDPNNIGMLLFLADYWSERGEQLDRADEYATKALDLLGRANKPDQWTDEQWAQQKSIRQGLANSTLGQIHIHKGRNAQAVDAFRAAAPLLKVDPVTYARNQYRLAFALLNLKRMPEARTVLTEAASIDSPYRAPAQEKLKTLPAAAPAKKRP